MRQLLRTILFLGITIHLFSCSSNVKYTIYGKIKNCNNCNGYTARIFYYSGITKDGYVLDTTIIKNNRFTFKGVIDTPDFYDVTVVGPKWMYPASVYLDTSTINITYDINQQKADHRAKPPLVKSQSKIQTDLNNYMQLEYSFLHSWDIKYNNLRKRYLQSMENNDSLTYHLADSIRYFRDSFKYYLSEAKFTFAKGHPSSIVSPNIMLNILNESSNIVAYQKLYYQFTRAVKESEYGQGYWEEVESLRQHSTGRLGKVVSILHGKTPWGDTLNIKNILQKNKIIFIDFWASWCGSCRLEMPDIKKLYQEYHDKGLGIVSISLDEDYSRWVRAIKEDSLPFHNISELKGGDGIDEKRFHVLGIPDNIVLNREGKIISSYIGVDSLARLLHQKLTGKKLSLKIK